MSNQALVPYDVAYGSQGLWLMIQSTRTKSVEASTMQAKRKTEPTVQEQWRKSHQHREHKRATEIYAKHDPSYRCSCSLCR